MVKPQEEKRLPEQKPRTWSCYNKCRGNCCSELFISINGLQKSLLKRKGYIIAGKDEYDFKMLSYRRELKIEKNDKKSYKITMPEYQIKTNPYNSKSYAYIKSKCKMLKQDNKCKVYIIRPQSCRVVDCPVFSTNPVIHWFGEQGYLSETIRRLKDVNKE